MDWIQLHSLPSSTCLVSLCPRGRRPQSRVPQLQAQAGGGVGQDGVDMSASQLRLQGCCHWLNLLGLSGFCFYKEQRSSH
jgi:hypothetical protein